MFAAGVVAEIALDISDSVSHMGARSGRPKKTEAKRDAYGTKPKKCQPAESERNRRAHERKKAGQWYLRLVVTVHDPCIGSLEREMSVGLVRSESADLAAFTTRGEGGGEP